MIGIDSCGFGVDKSHHLPSASWKMRTASGVSPMNWGLLVLPRVQRPENQRLWCLRAERDGHPSSRRENSLFLGLFVPFGPPTDWMRHIHIGEVDLFIRLPNQMSVSFRNILQDTPRNNILPAVWASPRPVRLTHRINHHTPTERKTSGAVKICWVNARALASWRC